MSAGASSSAGCVLDGSYAAMPLPLLFFGPMVAKEGCNAPGVYLIKLFVLSFWHQHDIILHFIRLHVFLNK